LVIIAFFEKTFKFFEELGVHISVHNRHKMALTETIFSILLSLFRYIPVILFNDSPYFLKIFFPLLCNIGKSEKRRISCIDKGELEHNPEIASGVRPNCF